MFVIPEYHNPVSLIPGGCPQILDFACEDALLDELIRYSFEEQEEKTADGAVRHLHVFARNEDGEFEDETRAGVFARGYGYELNLRKTMAPWLGQWLPVPFLRIREQVWPGTNDCRFERGPSNWARARLAQTGNVWRLVLAFDMTPEEKKPGPADEYPALTHEEVDANAHFRLAWRFRDNAWFMDLGWVDEWLLEIWGAFRAKSRKRAPEDEERKLEYLASYLCYLALVQKLSRSCEVYVVRPEGSSCVDVDLVLDIGNSRTTGILVETHAQSATNLNDSYLLQLRDMDEPHLVYTDPFETRVEFSEISFGNSALSLRSGRSTPAFAWPSPVRIGPEAGRLSTLSRCEKGSTGMSSPKRYLWDERDWKRTWRFNTKTEKAPYVTRGPLAQRINSSGTPLCVMNDPQFTRNERLRLQERESAFESQFTRSSLMMFLLVEIIQQALMTINSPGQRLRRELPAEPRRLRQIIFTVPAGMPRAEQNIYRRWADWAVRVLWESLGWQTWLQSGKNLRHGPADYRTSPIVRCDWDEATCTQLVYIYNEITRKFQGDAKTFCDLLGKEREVGGARKPTVRVAAIDMGGGTTDLSITTFELASGAGETPRMAPHPDFHDGFNLAGDDILRAVIADLVLPAIGAALENAGLSDMRAALAVLFGRDIMDRSKETQDQRIQFVRQVAVPAALCLLSLYERSDLHNENELLVFRLGDCFARGVSEEEDRKDGEHASLPLIFPAPGQRALDYVRDYARASGIADFDVMDTQIRLQAWQVDDTVCNTLREVLANLCELVNAYDCDVLLLTGRPSRWPGIANTLVSLLPVAPSRIIPMGDYRVGAWYPFADALGNITDPKTTVVVGAILCALAEGQLEGFSFDPSSLTRSSTARFIGEMELNGQIKKDKVWFEVDPEKNRIESQVEGISFSGPLSVGFRQLPVERWTTTRFYFLEFANENYRRENSRALPFRVRLELQLPEEGGEDEGKFVITEIEGKNGETISQKALEMRLQTLPRDEGFWMDTGIIYES